MSEVSGAMQAEWSYPTQICAGQDSRLRLPAFCRSLKIGKPLLVTDSGVAALPMYSELLALLQQAYGEIVEFSDIKANPDSSNVAAGLSLLRSSQCDGVVAVGGGSALDCAKALAVLFGQNGEIWDYEDVGDNWQRLDSGQILSLIALPTTAGTGSEVGRASVITDLESRRKRLIFHPLMMPRQVILDPVLTAGLPPALTAATGMDALSHAIEAWCAPGWHPLADGIALQAMRLVQEFLPRAYARGDDLEARLQMQVASTMGATAFQKGLGAMHALAHPLGAHFDKHHGLLNAVLMPYVLLRNRDAVAGRCADAARYLALPSADFDGFLGWVLGLRQQLGIPDNLAAIGISSEQVAGLGQAAFEDAAAATNPIALSAEQYQALLQDAVLGRLQARR